MVKYSTCCEELSRNELEDSRLKHILKNINSSKRSVFYTVNFNIHSTLNKKHLTYHNWGKLGNNEICGEYGPPITNT